MNGRTWSPEDSAQLKRLVARGMTDTQIGEEMNRHTNVIRARRKLAGLHPGQSAIFTAMMCRLNYRRMVRRTARA